jgi:predicted transglutaminase-like cysteine proteinase
MSALARRLAVSLLISLAALCGQARADAQLQASVPTADPAPLAVVPPNTAEPFGLNVVPVAGGDLVAKWTAIEANIRAENDVLARCRDNAAACPPAARNLLDIVAEGRAHTGRARIGVINRAINLAIRPASDFEEWGVPDHWSAPLDTLASGRGDCEDYAIAKYLALTEAGVAPQDVRLIIVRNLARGEDHAVVVVRLDGHWIVLDNRWLALVEDNAMRAVVPLFELDRDGVRMFGSATLPDGRRMAAPASFAFRR